ncbi:MAG TPA: PepSY domain-containing protein [Gemmatimonadaceae bacterium]|nr:PepSY domain-containing protein [Gemmatimonadaceae bacterium]
MSIRTIVARAAAVAAVVATVTAAPAARAQQTTPTDSGQHRGAQHSKMASKSRAASTGQSGQAAAAPAIGADSAKAIALANVPGATVKSAKLSRRSGHATYSIRLAGSQGQPDTWATVDATTGAFAKRESATAKGHAAAGGAHRSAAKKSSGR